ncbi:MAG: extracellular solute-binding protein [Microthrixaceae bacterium]
MAPFPNRRRSGARALILVLSAAVLMLPACSGDDADELVVYSGRSEELVGPLLERFSEETGISVAPRYGDSADLALSVASEDGRGDVDAFISQSPGATGYLAAEGQLEKLPDAVLDRVPEEDRDGDGAWVGLTGRARVLAYNPNLVDPADLPGSVFDLTDDAFAGDVALAPTNGSFQDFVTFMRSSAGEEATGDWLTAMADAGSPTFPNNVSIVEAIANNEVPMGLVNHYYIARAKATDPDVEVDYVLFDEGDPGSVLLATSVGVTKGADQPEAAQRLAEFLLSDESQQYFTEETQEYPLVEGIELSDQLQPLNELPVTRIDLNELGDGLEGTQRLIEASGLQ